MINRSIWIRHKFRLGRRGAEGDWSEDGSISHVVEAGRTLCGIDIPRITSDGKWMRDGYMKENDVNCVRCQRSLDKGAA